MDLSLLPKELLYDLKILAFHMKNKEFKVLRDTNFYEDTDNLPIINFLNSLI